MALHLFQSLPSPSSTNQRRPYRFLSLNKLNVSLLLQKPSHKLVLCSVSKSQVNPLYSPPSSREEAISQAKTCLSTTLQKSLKNFIPFSPKKIKKQKQPKYRVEIPVIDDSPNSIVKLAFEVFLDLPIKILDSKPTILLLYSSVLEFDKQSLSSGKFKSANVVINSQLSSVSVDLLNSSDLVVFLAPEESELEEIRTVTDSLNPKPVILLNPKWAFEDEKDFKKGLGNFLSPFQVVYCFTGLEVKGIFSNKRGVIMRHVKNGEFNEEGWLIMVEEGQNGQMKVITRFTQRPSIVEVEAVLYNLMAATSPVTKSVKFIKDLVSSVTPKKKE